MQYTVKECIGLTGDVEAYKRNRDILYNALTEYGYECAKPDGAFEIARRSRGTPRIANRLLKRVRDWAQVKGEGIIDRDTADASLNMLEIDALRKAEIIS